MFKHAFQKLDKKAFFPTSNSIPNGEKSSQESHRK